MFYISRLACLRAKLEMETSKLLETASIITTKPARDFVCLTDWGPFPHQAILLGVAHSHRGNKPPRGTADRSHGSRRYISKCNKHPSPRFEPAIFAIQIPRVSSAFTLSF
ncbi:hypothetical protein V2G26_009577 [Clonostachys chloroleuca]